MSHTPGPWTVIGKHGYAIWCGNEILTSVMRGASFAPSIAHANAVLMAAAPDLLELLEELAQMAHDDSQLFSDESVSKPFYIVHEQKIRTAIKKARGE